MSHQVFISYSSKDKKFAEKICSFLNKKGISCWISSKDIPAGADYQVCVVEAINTAQIVLLIFSANANSSNEIAKELSLASKKILIPTRIEDVIPEGAFQYQLSNRQFIDLFEDFDNRLQELAERIQSALEGVQHVPLRSVPPAMWKKRAAVIVAFAFVLSVGIGGWLFNRGQMGISVASSSTPTTDAAPIFGQVSAIVVKTPQSEQASLPVSASSAVISKAPDVVAERTLPQLAPALSLPVASLTRDMEISAKVSSFAATLKDKKENQRELALRDAKDSIPTNLNAKEADLLLRNLGSYRTNVITLLADNIAAGQGGDAVASILGDTVESNRQAAIQSLSSAEKIKQGLTASELNNILRNTGSYRANVIVFLSEKLLPNLDSAAVALVLGETSESTRLTALQGIVRAGIMKNGLSATETATILKNMGSYRTNAIAVISENLSTGLDGEALAIILGDTAESQRLTAINTLLQAEKIKTGLQSSDAVILLKNTGSYRSNAIKLIAENLAGNLEGAAIASILGATEGSSRLDALKGLLNASKLKHGLKPDEVQSIVKKMDTYALDGTKALAPLLLK